MLKNQDKMIEREKATLFPVFFDREGNLNFYEHELFISVSAASGSPLTYVLNAFLLFHGNQMDASP